MPWQKSHFLELSLRVGSQLCHTTTPAPARAVLYWSYPRGGRGQKKYFFLGIFADFIFAKGMHLKIEN